MQIPTLSNDMPIKVAIALSPEDDKALADQVKANLLSAAEDQGLLVQVDDFDLTGPDLASRENLVDRSRDLERELFSYNALILLGQESGVCEYDFQVLAGLARERNMVFLGLDSGFKAMARSFAQDVLGISADITLLASCLGGKARCKSREELWLEGESHLAEAYLDFGPADFSKEELKSKEKPVIAEQHYNSWEFNPAYQGPFIEHGFVFTASSVEGKFIEAGEIRDKDFYLGTIFVPGQVDGKAHPVYQAFIKMASQKA